MNERRTFLGTLAAGAVALPAAAALDQAGLLEREESCLPRGSSYFPNVALTSHEGRRALFYDDLLRGRTVLIHFMSLAQEELRARGIGSTVANLAKVQEILGPRLGRDVFIYSLTVDPEHDSPRALRELARRHGARPGWLFLTGEAEDMETLRSRFFVDRVALSLPAHQAERHGDHASGSPSGHDCSRGLLRYGNEAAGLWGSCPQIADPHWIAARLSWVMPRPRPEGPFRRGGPYPRPA
jgi:protein SCO1